jgi:outer membrane protein OmpA-like peptidoglycan-associated protein
MNLSRYFLIVTMCAASGVAGAQEMNPTAQAQPAQQPQAEMQGGIPVYKVTVVGRDIPAINYFHRSGSTKIGFEGTSLLPGAKGEASVEGMTGRVSIHAKFEGLVPANSFGAEYLTYVLWAITPEGRPVNLGEVLPNGGKGEINVTSNLQAFALIITAEPYFAVSMPSDLVVMQNVVTDKTQGIIEQVNAHATLLPRGAYTETAGKHTVLDPITRHEESPLELYEAVNAVRIAQVAGAAQYAPDVFQRATQNLQNAQDLDANKHDRKEEITLAREAVQSAEDARLITVRKMIAQDRQREVDEKQQAQAAALASQQQALQAQQAADQQAQARAKADADAAAAEARVAEARDAQKAAEASAQAATAQAQAAAQQTEQMREKLKAQLNQVLNTQETARGLVVNMSDVLFDFNKYTLKPEAREKLAKVSGILLSYPDLKLQVEGYTDNIGSDEYNQKLSEERAQAVSNYLTSQSVAAANVTATGYGKGDPIADNSTAAGRAQNRRVQLVVSGASIGVQESAPGTQSDMNAAPGSPAQAAAPSAGATGVSNPPQ